MFGRQATIEELKEQIAVLESNNKKLSYKNQQLESTVVSLGKNRQKQSDELAERSHSIRTPLNTIVGFTTIATETKGNPDKTQECLEQIKDATKHLLTLFNEFLEEPMQEQESFSLPRLLLEIEHIFMLRAQERQISFALIQTELGSDQLVGNRTQLTQVLMGLLNNIFDMSEEKDRIEFIVSTLEARENRTLLCFQAKNYNRSMKETYIEKTFLPFEEEAELSVINSLVSLLHGVVKIDSTIGEETLIRMEIPFMLKSNQDIRKIESANFEKNKNHKYVFSGQRILLADDFQVNRDIIAEYLQDAGLLVDIVENGREALERFEQSQEKEYSMILMDIRMPVMDGRMATKAIRALPRADAATIPIIAISADAYTEDIKYSQSIGMNEYLVKPIFKDILYSTITQYI
ncbi:MAG: response regulator [Lachnospiraceae bacterium]